MLTVFGGKQRFCDGISRRSFLKIGSFAMAGAAGVTLADLNRAEAAAGRRTSKALINIFLAGGPPHQDMWDLKPDAPAELRGEFKPINTNVSGIQICEVMPRIAKITDKLSIIRSLVGNAPDHDAYQCMTGWRRIALINAGGYPSVGSVVARLQGQTHRAVPAAVGLAAPTIERRWSDSGAPGYLGATYAPFKPFITGGQTGRLDTGATKSVSKYEGGSGLRLEGISLDRLNDRRRLLKTFDTMREKLDSDENIQAMDHGFQAAFDLLTSSRVADALDLSKEDPKVVERYGRGQPYNYQYDGPPTCNEHFLMARRLIEAGTRVVTLSFGRWDSHGKNFDLVRDHGPKFDQAFSALVEDLDHRGMLDDVTVVAWGEFGRTPVINKDAGRDHWPDVNSAVLAGGGMKCGQVIGSTTEDAGHAHDRPVQFQEVIATLYNNLEVDVANVKLDDRTGRPQYLLDLRDPMPELVG